MIGPAVLALAMLSQAPATIVCPAGSYKVVIPESPVIIKTPTSVTFAWSTPPPPPAAATITSFVVDSPLTITITWP